MKTIPTPVAICIILGAVVALTFTFMRMQNNKNGDSGNINELAKEVVSNNPKNAPKMPAGINPTAGAMAMGGKKK